MMKISFVIPAYNEEANIEKCVLSILQDAELGAHNFEIIVVNNASTDRTKEIASKLPRIKVVDEPKKGLSQARHSGFLASSGDLIANVDADTMLTPGWMDRVLKEFKKDPKLVALSGPFVYYDLPMLTNFAVKTFYGFGYITYVVNRFVFSIGSMLQGGNFIVRASALKKIGGFNQKFEFYGEDADMAKRLHKVGKVKFTFSLPMYSSGRRLQEEGIFVMGTRYAVNYFWTIFLGRPYSKTFKDIRKK